MNDTGKVDMSENDTIIISKTDTELKNLQKNFVNMDNSEKYKVSRQKLEDLQKQGLIKKGSIAYQEDEGLFSFDYNVGKGVHAVFVVEDKADNLKK